MSLIDSAVDMVLKSAGFSQLLSKQLAFMATQQRFTQSNFYLDLLQLSVTNIQDSKFCQTNQIWLLGPFSVWH